MTRLTVLLESTLAERHALAVDIERELAADRRLDSQRLRVVRSKFTGVDAIQPEWCGPAHPRRRHGRSAPSDELHEPAIQFVVTDERLELRDASSPRSVPVSVDFVELWTKRRMSGSQWRADPLLKAVDPHGERPGVLDATAGFGRDAFVLAAHGCRVTAFERSMLMGYLLSDGFDRALAHGPPEVQDALSRLTIVLHDARRELCSLIKSAAAAQHSERPKGDKEPCEQNSRCMAGELLRGRPDVVYLDPMFPIRRRNVVVKKELRLCRALVGDDDDASELLDAARRAAMVRVVVKRHRLAEPIAPGVHHAITSKLARFDVYLPLGA